MRDVELTVIVVSYNTRELTLECLRSVYTETKVIDFEVIVVDNASTDGSAVAISEEFPGVRLLACADNMGFAAANNLAAGEAGGEWVLLLNPDTVVLSRAIEKVMAFAAAHSETDRRFGIFGGRTLFPDGSLNPASCWRRPTLWSAFCYGSGLTNRFGNCQLFNPEAMPGWRRNTVREVDIVCGCFFLIRRRLWLELDGFDPSFFMYGEEADLCLRAHRRGIHCLICPDAMLTHYGGASEEVRSGKLVRLFRAKALLYSRNWSPVAARIGVSMLDLWALSRLLATTSSARLGSRPAKRSARTWREVWQQRRQWHDAARRVPEFSEPTCTAG